MTLFDQPPLPAAISRTFAVGDAVWVVVDRDVLPARVERCYVSTAAGKAGPRVVVRWPEAGRCLSDCFASSVFAEDQWDAAKQAASAGV